MAKKITQKELKHDEFVEAGLDIGLWVEEHWQTALKWAGVVVLAVVALLAGLSWSNRNQERARLELAGAIDRYEAAQATDFADNAELESLVTDLGQIKSGDAGKIASFYRGATLYRLGRYEDARTALSSVATAVGRDGTLGATASLMLARTEWASGSQEQAIAIFDEMIADANSAIPASQLLLESGRLLAESGDTEAARDRWQQVVDDFPGTPASAEANRLTQ